MHHCLIGTAARIEALIRTPMSKQAFAAVRDLDTLHPDNIRWLALMAFFFSEAENAQTG